MICASCFPSRILGVGGVWRCFRLTTASIPSVTSRRRTFSIVLIRQDNASAILASGQLGPSTFAVLFVATFWINLYEFSTTKVQDVVTSTSAGERKTHVELKYSVNGYVMGSTLEKPTRLAFHVEMRTPGGFLVSGRQKDGTISDVTVESTVGGELKLVSPGSPRLLARPGPPILARSVAPIAGPSGYRPQTFR